ncbi:MATE family efflux transporter [Butyrivibrio sp. VCD2006]|uniref:MATE family efflux transporter n=1 Tax=Butyrivibrio sp. VCD2006 TaxID=1280664 RepID=UPI00040277AD|nr:MATE family efflux transporter [Butyrivibrio sp. VCD2006]
MKKHTTDMTTGNPVKHILLFALPALIGNIFQQIYNLADTIIVGRFVGADALAAVGATASVTFLFFALCNGIGGGGGIIVSQFYGAHDDDNVKKSIVNTGIIMLIVPLFFGTIGFISCEALLKLLGTPEAILADSVSYMRYMCVGLLFVSAYNYLTSMLRALGDSKSPLYFLIIAAVINVFLDIFLVYFCKMGINGAAIATIISQSIAAISCGLYARKVNPYFKLNKNDLVFRSDLAIKIIRLGVPMSLQFALIAISSMAVQRIVNSYGTVVVAAFTATNRIEQLIHQPYATLGAAIATYCGQNYGAGKYDRVYTGYRKGLMIMAVLTAVMVVSIQVFGGTITSMFVSDNDVIALGSMGLKITSLFYISLGLIYVVRGVLTGIGDAFFALFNGIVEVIGRFTIPLFITQYMGMGEKGIWISAGIVWVLSGVTAWLRFATHFGEATKVAEPTQ